MGKKAMKGKCDDELMVERERERERERKQKQKGFLVSGRVSRIPSGIQRVV